VPIPYLPIGCTTGMSDRVHAHNPYEVLACLQECDYEPHKNDVYDCEDRAFWGIAHARRKFPGQPMAAAFGKARSGENHAVIVFWSKVGKDKYVHHFFDPEGSRKGKTEKVAGGGVNGGKLIDNFDTKILVPFPMWRPESETRKELEQQEPGDFEGFTYRSGAAVLDGSYTLFDYNSLKNIVDYLENFGEQPSSDFWRIEEKVLWAWVHARREFKGYAIGMAFGKYLGAKEDEDPNHAFLVFWRKDKPYLYYDLKTGFPNNPDNFKPRTLIV
jgi:hypothetical protein